MNDDDQPATAETIIHALSQFGAEQEEQHASNQLDQYSTLLSNQENSDQHDLGGLTRGELEAEVLKLRGLVYQESLSASGSPSENIPPVKRRRRDGVKATVTEKNRVDGQTGKRVERGRKTELYKAIRQTMRVYMGMEKESDPLPAPMSAATSSADHTVWVVPDWQAPVGDGANARWMESIASELSQTLQSESNPHQKVEEDDKDLPTVLEAVKVTFANYVKRYKSENDSTHAERKARYAKNRRRWARKDLEKRSKARNHLEPTHPCTSLPQSALLFNYQSSEYSSPGSDSSDSDNDFHQEKVRKRKELWEGMRNAEAGPSGTGKEYGWGMGLGMKVLEVRTPSWRSEKLNEYYAHLDSLSEMHAQNRNTPRSQPRQTTTTVKAGHVAPSHRRFTLPPEIRRKGMKRSGKGKKRKNSEGDEGDAEDEGEGWMWATAKVGVWPSRSKTLVEGEAVEAGDGGITLIS